MHAAKSTCAIKKESIAKAKQEEKISKEFAAMEAAALKANEEDLKSMNTQSGESLTATEAPVNPQTKGQHQAQRRELKVHKETSSSSCNNENNPVDVWMEGTTDDGHIYYYNTITGECLWEKPDGLQSQNTPSSSSSSSAAAAAGQTQESSVTSWMEAVSPEGFMYYYNTETGESSWEKPENFSPSDGSPHEVSGAAEEPESLSAGEISSDAPKDTTEPEPAETKHTDIPKTGLRVRHSRGISYVKMQYKGVLGI
ncbi:WW domain-binding protein 4-like [Xyrauchen texanus]|uniref:WW domain-binding protein 4-like n=1 Tax=Xyrauchen texanus TaxID=154827 RepID=UPI0022419ED9|nr:WW domain-binding protein 4-like [Xyrauchen texanus]